MLNNSVNKNVITSNHLNKRNSLNQINIAYFFFDKKVHLINSDTYEKHKNYQCWTNHLKCFFGFNRNFLFYMLPILGYNRNILFTNTDEYYFTCFKYLLRYYGYYFTLSWYFLYLRQRHFILPLFDRGIRFYKKLPCRGQRTKSNYKNSRKVNKNVNLSFFKKKLNKRFIIKKFPSFNEMHLFYFHRF